MLTIFRRLFIFLFLLTVVVLTSNVISAQVAGNGNNPGGGVAGNGANPAGGVAGNGGNPLGGVGGNGVIVGSFATPSVVSTLQPLATFLTTKMSPTSSRNSTSAV